MKNFSYVLQLTSAIFYFREVKGEILLVTNQNHDNNEKIVIMLPIFGYISLNYFPIQIKKTFSLFHCVFKINY